MKRYAALAVCVRTLAGCGADVTNGDAKTVSRSPAKGDGTIEAKVSSVDGLLVNFNDKVVS